MRCRLLPEFWPRIFDGFDVSVLAMTCHEERRLSPTRVPEEKAKQHIAVAAASKGYFRFLAWWFHDVRPLCPMRPCLGADIVSRAARAGHPDMIYLTQAYEPVDSTLWALLKQQFHADPCSVPVPTIRVLLADGKLTLTPSPVFSTVKQVEHVLASLSKSVDKRILLAGLLRDGTLALAEVVWPAVADDDGIGVLVANALTHREFNTMLGTFPPDPPEEIARWDARRLPASIPFTDPDRQDTRAGWIVQDTVGGPRPPDEVVHLPPRRMTFL